MTGKANVTLVSVGEVDRLRTSPDVQLIDVRLPFDYFGGRVPGALNVPGLTVAGQIGQIPSDRKLVVICNDGEKSLEAAAAATQAGFTDVVVLEGGFDAWAEADLPIETISDGMTPDPVRPAG